VNDLAREHPEIIFAKADGEKIPSIKGILGVGAMHSFLFRNEGNTVGSLLGANEDIPKLGIANGGNVGEMSSSMCSIP